MHYLEAAGYYLRHSVAKGLCWNSARSLNAGQGLSIPPRIAWSSRAGAFWHLGVLAAEQSVRGLAVPGMCSTVNGFLSDWSVLQELHQWTHISDSNRLRAPKAGVNWLRILHWKIPVYSEKSVVFVIFQTNPFPVRWNFYFVRLCL